MISDKLKPYKKQFKNSTFCVGEIFFDWVKILNESSGINDEDGLYAFVAIYEYYRERSAGIQLWEPSRLLDKSNQRMTLLRDILFGLYPQSFRTTLFRNHAKGNKYISAEQILEYTKPLIHIPHKLIINTYKYTINQIHRCHFHNNTTPHKRIYKEQHSKLSWAHISNNLTKEDEIDHLLFTINQQIAELATRNKSLIQRTKDFVLWMVKKDIENEEHRLQNIITSPQTNPKTANGIKRDMCKHMEEFTINAYKSAGCIKTTDDDNSYYCPDETAINRIRSNIIDSFSKLLRFIPSNEQSSLLIANTKLSDTTNHVMQSAKELHEIQTECVLKSISKQAPNTTRKGKLMPAHAHLNELGIYRILSALASDLRNKNESLYSELSKIEQKAWDETQKYKPSKATHTFPPIYTSPNSILSYNRNNSNKKPIVVSVEDRLIQLFDDDQMAMNHQQNKAINKFEWDRNTFYEIYYKFTEKRPYEPSYRSMRCSNMKTQHHPHEIKDMVE